MNKYSILVISFVLLGILPSTGFSLGVKQYGALLISALGITVLITTYFKKQT